LRTSSSIYPFEAKALKTWGLKNYNQDPNCNLVYFGMYHDGDYKSLFFHKGKTVILWAGSDILALKDKPDIQKKIIEKKSIHYCENNVEQKELEEMGIKAEVVPSFLEDINDFPISFKPTKPFKIFLSGHPDRENEYGFDLIGRLADEFKDVEFHLYGAVGGLDKENVVEHGLIDNNAFNEQIKGYHCGLRPNRHDGASEIMVKSILLGQYPITYIDYPFVSSFKKYHELKMQIKETIKKKEPNYKAREEWVKILNKYIWVK